MQHQRASNDSLGIATFAGGHQSEGAIFRSIFAGFLTCKFVKSFPFRPKKLANVLPLDIYFIRR